MKVRFRLPPREVIGVPECPLFYRWTLRPWGKTGHADVGWKLMVHKFLPRADDRDPHDHPRAFWTLVLWGYYDDLAPCDWCDGTGNMYHASGGERATDGYCLKCASTGFLVRERMRPGMLRYRPATHTHRTRVGPKGCWTVVLMGPLRRPWGFWRRGQWWSLKDYERTFGPAMRCEEPPPTTQEKVHA